MLEGSLFLFLLFFAFANLAFEPVALTLFFQKKSNLIFSKKKYTYSFKKKSNLILIVPKKLIIKPFFFEGNEQQVGNYHPHFADYKVQRDLVMSQGGPGAGDVKLTGLALQMRRPQM
jgi:hypothetical protein